MPKGVKRLIQVVPRLGPFDGVGDYARCVAERLHANHALQSVFIEAGTRQGSAGLKPEIAAIRSSAGSAEALGAALEQAGVTPEDRCAVLLHYVGYGYAKRGAPFWLLRAIARTHRNLDYRLGIVFHELYATGRPWQSSFWCSGPQRIVAARLARECDGALVTREGNRQWLDRTGALAGKAVAVLPVPSTVGEPAGVAPVDARDGSLVVWGSAAMKRGTYGAHWPRLVEACRGLGIERIVDIGAPASGHPVDAAIRIEKRGFLAAADVSRILAGARFGLVVYPASFLAKSSMFAACAAHGVVPLVLDDSGSRAMDGLADGRNYLNLANAGDGVGDGALAAIASAGRAWYSAHTAAAHAAAVLGLFRGAST